MRQVRAGHVDGDGPAGSAVGLSLRRNDPPRHLPGPRHHDPGRVRGGRRAREGSGDRRRAPRARTRGVPDRGVVRRDVHGEHDGRRRRGARHVATGARSRHARAGSRSRTSWSSISGRDRS
jgi:hypothetical protein